jgi:hypothetical protein
MSIPFEKITQKVVIASERSLANEAISKSDIRLLRAGALAKTFLFDLWPINPNAIALPYSFHSYYPQYFLNL